MAHMTIDFNYQVEVEISNKDREAYRTGELDQVGLLAKYKDDMRKAQSNFDLNSEDLSLKMWVH